MSNAAQELYLEDSWEIHSKLEKWSPLQGERAHELIPCIFEFSKTKQREEGTEQQQQTYQFTQGYNILHRLKVHHRTLTFIIHNKYSPINIYQHYYRHTYMNCSSQLY